MRKFLDNLKLIYDWIFIFVVFMVGALAIIKLDDIQARGIWQFLNSNFFQGLATLVAAFIVVVGGLLAYFTQRRVDNLKKIYFEDAFLEAFKDTEKGINICNNFIYISEEIINLILNFIEQTYVNKKTFFEKIELLRMKMTQEVEPFYFKEIPKVRIGEIFSDNHTYLIQWIDKIQYDCIHFIGAVRGQTDILINNLITYEVRDKEKDKKMLDDIRQDIQNAYYLIQRHYALLYYLGKLISKFNLCRYYSLKELIKFSSKYEIKKLIKKINETFLTIFTFYQLTDKDDEILYSYTLDEYGNRFKITKIKNSNKFKVQRVKKDIDNSKYRLVTFNNEGKFANSIIEDTKNNFITALIGLGNMILFEEKPNIIKSIYKF